MLWIFRQHRRPAHIHLALPGQTQPACPVPWDDAYQIPVIDPADPPPTQRTQHHWNNSAVPAWLADIVTQGANP
jgi:hypothetical protein